MKRNPLIFSSIVALSLAWVGPAQAVGFQVDPSTTFQTMKGWEVTINGFSFLTPDPRTDMYNDQLDPYRVVLVDKMVNELGINRVRLEIRSGAENPDDWFGIFLGGTVTNQSIRNHRYEKINDNADPMIAAAAGFQWTEIDHAVEKGVLPMKQLVEANGETLYVSLCYVDFRFEPDQGSLSHGTIPAEYAELITETFKHLDTTYNLVPDALEVILEPENTVDWASDMIGPAMVAAVTRLRSEGYDPEVVAPSVKDPNNAVSYLDDIMGTSGANGMVTMLSTHNYVLGNYAPIWTAAQGYGLEMGMLEHTEANAEILWDHLTIGNVSAWQKWAVVAADPMYDNDYYISDLNASTPNATMTRKTSGLMPFFRYVRAGAQRFEVTADASGWFGVGFRNTNGSHVFVLRTAPQAGTLDLSGMPDGTYNITRVASDGAVTEETDVTVSGGSLSTTTLGNSVMAVYDTNTPGPNGGIGTGGSSGMGGSGGAAGGSAGSTGGSAGSTGGSTSGSGGTTGGTGGSTGGSGGSTGGSGGSTGGTDTGEGGMNATGGTTSTTGGSSSSGAGGRGGTTSAGGAAGTGPATAQATSDDDGGCGCRVAGSSDTRGRHFGAGALFLALAFLTRRQRR